MSRTDGPENEAVFVTRTTGVLPAMKIKAGGDLVSYVRAMYEGGARVIEITTTTPGDLRIFRDPQGRAQGQDLPGRRNHSG